jgi:hypothetical protein
MAKRKIDLKVDEDGLEILIRKHPKTGVLEGVAKLPKIDAEGNRRIVRLRCSLKTTDAEVALRNARAWARRLKINVDGLARATLKSKFFNGRLVTDLDVLDYYEAEVIPTLEQGSEYRKQAESKLRVLRALLPQVARRGDATPLISIDKQYIDRYQVLRLSKGALLRDGSGEWRTEYPASKRGRKVAIRTVATDLLVLRRAVHAAKAYLVEDYTGRMMSAVQYDPFADPVKKLRLPAETDMTRQPIMAYQAYDQMLAVADAFDQRANAEYIRLGYPERHPHYAPRCPGYTDALLKVARQGRRRGDFTRLTWEDVIFPEDAEGMVTKIYEILSESVGADEARRIFPTGMIVWPRGKTGVYRFAPMPEYLMDSLATFKRGHPHRDNPLGPVFYAIRNSQKAVTVRSLAQWYPKLQELAGIEHRGEEGWHMFRRLFRQERQGRISNKIVAYCGGWSKLNAVHKLLDVDEKDVMNSRYLQVLLRQMFACMVFDATRLKENTTLPGVSDHVIAQLREIGYLSPEDAPDQE